MFQTHCNSTFSNKELSILTFIFTAKFVFFFIFVLWFYMAPLRNFNAITNEGGSSEDDTGNLNAITNEGGSAEDETGNMNAIAN